MDKQRKDKIELIDNIKKIFNRYRCEAITSTELEADILIMLDTRHPSGAATKEDKNPDKCSCGGGQNNGHDWNCPWQQAQENKKPFDALQDRIDTEKEWANAQIAAPQAAGPIWVKASERLPKKGIRVMIRRTDDHDTFTRSEQSNYPEEWNAEGWFYDDTEWLDESITQQLFTRKDMEKCFEAGGEYIVGAMNMVTTATFDEYMNTNYPKS